MFSKMKFSFSGSRFGPKAVVDNHPDGLLQKAHLPGHWPHGLERVPFGSMFDLGHRGLIGNKIHVIGSWLSFGITLTQQTIFDVVNCLSGHIKGLENL